MSVEAPADEPVWSVNLKKGVIAMLQVNLNAANQIEDADPAVAEMFMANTAKPAAGAKYFRAMEVGVTGDYITRKTSGTDLLWWNSFTLRISSGAAPTNYSVVH